MISRRQLALVVHLALIDEVPVLLSPQLLMMILVELLSACGIPQRRISIHATK